MVLMFHTKTLRPVNIYGTSFESVVIDYLVIYNFINIRKKNL